MNWLEAKRLAGLCLVDQLTFSRSMAFIAESMPLTTLAILPVTCRIVTAVCTRELTASMREARRSRFSFSFCLRIAFWA